MQTGKDEFLYLMAKLADNKRQLAESMEGMDIKTLAFNPTKVLAVVPTLASTLTVYDKLIENLGANVYGK